MRNNNFVFGQKPNVYKSRSRFNLSHGVKTMFNLGDLVPIDVQEVYPGDTFKLKSSSVIRTTVPFVRPIMDNMFLDTYYFFVPNRLVFDDFTSVMGENKKNAWANSEIVQIPFVNGTVIKNTIADYMGLNPGVYNGGVSRLPFRAFAKIYDDWFRDENVQDPILINTSSIDTTSFNNNEFGPNNIYGKVPKANKLHDYFTSCLPAPQKGSPVDIPITGSAPVKTSDTDLVSGRQYGMTVRYADGSLPPVGSQGNVLGTKNITGGGGQLIQTGVALFDTQTAATNNQLVYPTNMYAELGDLDININDLRSSFALQRMLEKDARGGTRYVEYLQEHFGVVSPDARLQRSEFLGGKRTPINISQVNQTAPGIDSPSPVGEVGANSLTNAFGGYSKAFVEHGFVIGVAVVRQLHTYQQGIEKFWSRRNRIDFYDPVFSHIGEQPIMTREIFATAPENDVFGYNEAWVDLRYRPSKITGELRSSADNGLDIWHLGDYYKTKPLLSPEFMTETNIYLDRTLSAGSITIPNFVCDFWFNVDAIRVLPTYGTPGLIDHD